MFDKFNPFRVWREYLDRIDKRAERQRAHEVELLQAKLANDLEQRVLLNDTLKYLADQNTKQTEAMKTLALKVAENNELATGTIGKWLDSFRTVEVPTSSVATEDDEILNYRNRTLDFERRVLDELNSSEFVAQANSPIPPEMALALQLHRQDKR